MNTKDLNISQMLRVILSIQIQQEFEKYKQNFPSYEEYEKNLSFNDFRLELIENMKSHSRGIEL